ncbi:MAG: Two component regulator propeller domain protein [Candidatus Woesebacteria bacterium GW2011_GWC1_42_9]|nr:MAG: Two component regulator propeller domain protein [Candidatus Woesebacteria bacterium GW2011_GWC1_42_9]
METQTLIKSKKMEAANQWLLADSWTNESAVAPGKRCRSGAPFTVQIVNACTSAISNVDIGDSYNNRTQPDTLGSTWAATNEGLENLVIRAFGVNGSNIFVGNGAGDLYLSTNNGSSWTDVPYSQYARYWQLGAVYSIVFGNETNMFVGGAGGVLLSTNNGVSWSNITDGLTNTSVFALLTDGSNLFAGTAGGVFLSTDNGHSWTEVNTGLTNLDVQKFAIRGNNIFAATLGGVFLTSNNGTSWTAVNTGLTTLDVYSLAISGDNLFAATLGGVFLTANNGTSWTAVNTGLTTLDVYSIQVVGKRIFAGTFGGGIFVSTNNGTSWSAFNTGLTTLIVWAMASSGNTIFAGTGGGGVFYNTISNFGQNSNITVTSPVNGLAFTEFLAKLESSPVKINKTEIISSTTGQLDNTVVITHRDSNGDRVDHVVAPVIDPNQIQTDRISDPYEFLFDGFTRMRLGQVNGSTTVTIRLYPEQCGDRPTMASDFLPEETFFLPDLIKATTRVRIGTEKWNPKVAPEFEEFKVRMDKFQENISVQNVFEELKKKNKFYTVICLS